MQTLTMKTANGETLTFQALGDGRMALFTTDKPGVPASATFDRKELAEFTHMASQASAQLRVDAARPPNAEPIARKAPLGQG